MKISEGTIRSDLISLHEYNVNIDTREIYLHGYYASGGDVEEAGVDYRMATVFIKNLNFLNSLSNSAILIHQHTIGGTWNDGIAIYDSLLMSKSETAIVCYAEASSMSSITIQAATIRALMPNIEFMVHYGFYGADGIPSQVHSLVDRYKQIDTIMLNIYARRCIHGKFFQNKRMNERDVIKYIRDKIQRNTDWFMNAEEAVFYGFADLVLDSKGINDIYSLRQSVKKKNGKTKRKRN